MKNKSSLPHLGKNMRHALTFAQKHSGWHTYNVTQRATMSAINSLAKLGLVQVNEFNQFCAV
jgi:hypothetical protein